MSITKKIKEICSPLKEVRDELYNFCVKYGYSEVQNVFTTEYDSEKFFIDDIIMGDIFDEYEGSKRMEDVMKKINDKPLYSLYELNLGENLNVKEAKCMLKVIKRDRKVLKSNEVLQILKEAVNRIYLMNDILEDFEKREVDFPFFKGEIYLDKETGTVLGIKDIYEEIESFFYDTIVETESFNEILNKNINSLNKQLKNKCGVDINDIYK